MSQEACHVGSLMLSSRQSNQLCKRLFFKEMKPHLYSSPPQHQLSKRKTLSKPIFRINKLWKTGSNTKKLGLSHRAPLSRERFLQRPQISPGLAKVSSGMIRLRLLKKFDKRAKRKIKKASNPV